MFIVGGLLLVAFGLWEAYGTSHPMMPSRVINRSLVSVTGIGFLSTQAVLLQVCSIIIDFTYFLSGYISDTYFWSWVYVVKDWDVRQCLVLPEFISILLNS
jgi:hypothetical protein